MAPQDSRVEGRLVPVSTPSPVLVLRLGPLAPATRAALQASLGPVRFTGDGAELELAVRSPEEVLSVCVALGILIRGSWVRQC
jgi:hypothetical protein